jgi:hypothetical protein
LSNILKISTIILVAGIISFEVSSQEKKKVFMTESEDLSTVVKQLKKHRREVPSLNERDKNRESGNTQRKSLPNGKRKAKKISERKVPKKSSLDKKNKIKREKRGKIKLTHKREGPPHREKQRAIKKKRKGLQKKKQFSHRDQHKNKSGLKVSPGPTGVPSARPRVSPRARPRPAP